MYALQTFDNLFRPLDTTANVVADDASFTIDIDVPGVKPEDIEVTVAKNVLSVRGKSASRRFARSWTVPDSVDLAAVSAAYDLGVLTVTLPKKEEEKPRVIEVKRVA